MVPLMCKRHINCGCIVNSIVLCMLYRLVSLLSQEDCSDELVREAIITLGSFSHGREEGRPREGGRGREREGEGERERGREGEGEGERERERERGRGREERKRDSDTYTIRHF